MSTVKYTKSMSDFQIEERARKMGMKYPDDMNVIINKDVK
jgi:hypothetical protein